MTRNIILGVLTAVAMTAAPAQAGEITGNGKDIARNGQSACSFSGLNDTPDGLWLPIGQGGFAVRLMGSVLGWHIHLPEQTWSWPGALP